MSQPQLQHQEEEFQGHLNWGLWKDLFLRSRAFWKYIYAMMAIAIILAAIDTLFTLVQKWTIDELVAHGPAAAWARFAWIYFTFVLVFAMLVMTFIWLGGKISTGISHMIRQRAFEQLQKLSFSYYDDRPVGWMVTRLTSDCDRLSRLLAWGILDIVWGVFFLAFIAMAMLWLDWRVALAVLVVLPPLGIVSVIFQRKLLRTSRQVRKVNSNITASYNEAIMGVRTTKAMVREEENLREFRDQTGSMFEWSVKNAILNSLYLPTVLALGSVGAALAMWYGGWRYQAGMIVQIGTVWAFMNYSWQFFMPIQELARVFAEMQSAQAAAERVLGLIDTPAEIQDTPEVQDRLRQFRNARAPGQAIDGHDEQIRSIELRGVEFAYKRGGKVLEDFNLTVSAGETIALIGPTGGGKSTIVSLVCRFYEPTAGELLINGVDYRSRSLEWLQGNLGIVLQSPHLFSGTIRENIRYGRLNATDEEVEQAAKLVNAHAFIVESEKGYDTPVGEGGGSLSTGQRQLISFARAILSSPQIFVMDEATSSVDTETEQLIQQGLHRVLEGRISFVIAHRLSTIRSADRILVIDGGRIVESGSHRELIAHRGNYYELYTNQFTQERSAQAFSESP